MSLLSNVIKTMNEDAAAGAVSAGSIATHISMGLSKQKPIKRKKIRRLFTEDREFDQASAISQIRNAERQANDNKDVVGYALEDDDGNIVKLFVKRDQSEEFESSLNTELEKNQNDEHRHREIGEIIYDLKNDFDIVNIQMGAIPEDEEELEDIKNDSNNSELELVGEPEDDDDTAHDNIDDESEMTPDSTSDSSGNAKSALDAVIDMMKADAEARKADAEAKSKESESKIAALNMQAAEEQVKKSEEVMDMEAYYKEKTDKDKESKQLAKLAQYKHDLANDAVEADTDFLEPDNQFESHKISSRLLGNAILKLKGK